MSVHVAVGGGGWVGGACGGGGRGGRGGGGDRAPSLSANTLVKKTQGEHPLAALPARPLGLLFF